jgi:hypothetical protein
MRRELPADAQVTVVMERVLAQAPAKGRRATVTAVERALGIPHATFDPDQVLQRLRRENEDLCRLVKIYAESIRQLTLDHLELEAKLNTAVGVTTLAHHRNR